AQEAPYIARCLADALLVLDKGDANIAFAIFPKANTRRYRNLSLNEQLLGKFHRARLPKGLWDRGPSEHGGGRTWYVPAGARHGIHENIAPGAINRTDLVRTVLWAVQRHRRRTLNGRVRAIIEIGLYPRKRCNERLVACCKPHAP